MTKFTCTKTFADFAFAHRQHTHDGHCALIHGHNWAFEFTFAADRLDPNGFVVDFGKLKWLKGLLEGYFDHTLLLNRDDPELGYLKGVLTANDRFDGSTREKMPLAKIIVVPNCGAEKLAEWLLKEVNDHLGELYGDRQVRAIKVQVFEDARNSATCED